MKEKPVVGVVVGELRTKLVSNYSSSGRETFEGPNYLLTTRLFTLGL